MPALKPKPFADNEKLRKIAELPEWARGAFAGMEQLNRIQSRVCDCAMFSGENMLVCAPTGESVCGLVRDTLARTTAAKKRRNKPAGSAGLAA